MSHELSSVLAHDRAMSQLVEKASRHWEAQRRAAAAQPDLAPRTSHAFTIALARQGGTQGTQVANEVGRLLGWPVYDHELVEKIAQEMGLRTALLESVDERQQSWLREAIQTDLACLVSGRAAPWASESDYVHHLIATVRALGIHGECTIVGRGSAFLLPAETTLRVRLVAPLRDRITALARTLGLSERAAARQLRTIDRERTDFVQDHFGKDPNDPANYDLVLNAARLSVVQLAELIVKALHLLQASGRSGQ